MRTRLLVLASLWLAACGGDPHHATEAESASEEGSSVVIESGDALGTQHTEAPTPTPSEASVTSQTPLSLHALVDVEAEDGAHHRAQAAHAVAFDIDGRLVPARALDPVLHVGQRVLYAYRFPRPGIMRFVLDQAQLPEDGVEVFVQFGDDFEHRIVLGTLDAREGRGGDTAREGRGGDTAREVR